MNKLMLLCVILVLLLTGCTGLSSTEVVEEMKRGATEIQVKLPKGVDATEYLAEVTRNNVLILGEDVKYTYSKTGKFEISYLATYKKIGRAHV